MLGALAADPSNGAILAGLAGCEACHTSDEGESFAGGHGIESPFGVFYGSNLTPDPTHGIGEWEYADFERAIRRGKGPKHTYWPAFPYPSLGWMSDSDLQDIWAFLQTLPAVAEPNIPHEGPAGWKRWAWRRLSYRPRPFEVDPDATDEQRRGQYLVDAVGHCGECHSPRNKYGKVLMDEYLEGGTEPFSDAPPIDSEALGEWSESDVDTFLEMGMLPDGDFVGEEMYRVIEDGTSKLSSEDRAAIAAWLKR